MRNLDQRSYLSLKACVLSWFYALERFILITNKESFKALDLEKSQVIFDEMKYSYELVLFWFFVY